MEFTDGFFSFFKWNFNIKKRYVKKLTKCLKFTKETDTINLAEFVNFLIDGGIKND